MIKYNLISSIAFARNFVRKELKKYLNCPSVLTGNVAFKGRIFEISPVVFESFQYKNTNLSFYNISID